jgi:2-O-methyltransferase
MNAARRELTPEFWRELGGKLPPRPVIVDLGAHGLEEAQQLLPHLRGATWWAIEADPALARHCLSMAAQMNQDGNVVRVENFAVASEDGDAVLYRSSMKSGDPWTPSSSTHRPAGVLSAYPWMDFKKADQVIVRSRTLDRLCQMCNISRIDFLKMDIQGAEIDAVRGGQEILTKTEYILTEVVENQEYEGQASLDELLASLPGKWEIVERLVNDALLVNKSLNPREAA